MATDKQIARWRNEAAEYPLNSLQFLTDIIF